MVDGLEQKILILLDIASLYAFCINGYLSQEVVSITSRWCQGRCLLHFLSSHACIHVYFALVATYLCQGIYSSTFPTVFHGHNDPVILVFVCMARSSRFALMISQAETDDIPNGVACVHANVCRLGGYLTGAGMFETYERC